MTTYQAHEPTEPTAVTAANSPAGFRLDEELHDSHSGAIDSILLAARSCTTRLVEQLRSLRHRKANKVGLRTGATAAARGEFLKYLEERS